jgi:hypothetical protein
LHCDASGDQLFILYSGKFVEIYFEPKKFRNVYYWQRDKVMILKIFRK